MKNKLQHVTGTSKDKGQKNRKEYVRTKPSKQKEKSIMKEMWKAKF